MATAYFRKEGSDLQAKRNIAEGSKSGGFIYIGIWGIGEGF